MYEPRQMNRDAAARRDAREFVQFPDAEIKRRAVAVEHSGAQAD